jgi:hypothetical protein
VLPLVLCDKDGGDVSAEGIKGGCDEYEEEDGNLLPELKS